MFALLRTARNAVPVGFGRRSVVRAAFLTNVALITVFSASSGAFAQCHNRKFNFAGISNLHLTIQEPSPFVSIMNSVNTAFLTNSTSFVSAPAGPQPDQGSGGVWSRAIDGFVDSAADSTAVVRPGQKFGPPFSGEPTGEQKCHQTSQQEYAGFQIGTDIGKLNIGNSGGNLHFGVTASFFDAWAR